MKKLSVLISFFCIPLLLQAQTPQYKKLRTITIPPETLSDIDKDSIITGIYYGDYIKFRLEGINTFKYNADLTIAETNFDFDLPDNIMPTEESRNSEDDSLNSDIQGLKIAGKLTDQKASIIQDMWADVQDKSNTWYENLGEYQKALIQLQQYARVKKRILDIIGEEPVLPDYESRKEAVANYFSGVYGDKDTNKATRAITSTFQKASGLLYFLKQQHQQLLQALTALEKQYNECAAYVTARKQALASQLEWITQTGTVFTDAFKKTKLLDDMHSGVTLYVHVYNASFSIETKVVQAKADEMRITPFLKDQKGNKAYEFGTYGFRTRGGVKVDFSAGYLLSFQGNDNYELVKNEDGETTGVQKGNKDRLTHTIGALAHIYSRGWRDVQPGFSAGASLSENGSLGFYSGLSLLFNGQSRVVFTAGVSFTQLDELNTANLESPENGIREFRSETDTEIRYDQTYRPAFFIGLTYNFSKKKKEDTQVGANADSDTE
ncbi:hypothetical protein [Ascidiimonas aurantiaca]|uniref:hypothetical protein n=1 Tax=Ascidiimonas aurantiaca TaxID=1685432 RepID=UPI0030EC7BFD